MSGATTPEENPHNLSFRSLVARHLVGKAIVRCETLFPSGAPLLLPPTETPEYNPIPAKYSEGPALEDLPICIIGAGIAGLYTAMKLDRLGLQYEIIEASGRHGGRIYTYHFETPENSNFHNYYDVGAMRFPRTKVMGAVFELFRELDLDKEGKIIKYISRAPGNIELFNGKCLEPGYRCLLKGF